jgi:hypothetical protein
MATVLQGLTTEEQRSLIRFLLAKELNAKDVHKEVFPIYGGKCLSRSAAHNWDEKFSQGRSKSQMMPDQVALLRLRQKQLCSGWKS